MFRLAHLSDLHLYPPGAMAPWHWLGRRAFGALNLFAARVGVHSLDVARAAVEAVREAGVDHVVVTGDIGNLALDDEFALGVDVLSPLGGFDRLSVVPGNHDYYTPESVQARRFERHFGHWLWPEGEGTWPAVKDFGPVRLILACSAAVPPPLFASGWIGPGQAQHIRQAADRPRRQGAFTVLALHHNLHRRGPVNEVQGRLVDRERVLDTLRNHPIDLALYGHDHRPRDWTLPRQDGGTVRMICGGSTSFHDPKRGREGGFHVYSIDQGRLSVEHWRYRPEDHRFTPE